MRNRKKFKNHGKQKKPGKEKEKITSNKTNKSFNNK